MRSPLSLISCRMNASLQTKTNINFALKMEETRAKNKLDFHSNQFSSSFYFLYNLEKNAHTHNALACFATTGKDIIKRKTNR